MPRRVCVLKEKVAARVPDAHPRAEAARARVSETASLEILLPVGHTRHDALFGLGHREGTHA